MHRSSHEHASYNRPMAGIETVLEQALQLSPEERGDLVAQLLRSLGPADENEVHGDDWQSSWSTEINGRAEAVRSGAVDLVDGDEALAGVRRSLATRPR